jgi:hypothetical protein
MTPIDSVRESSEAFASGDEEARAHRKQAIGRCRGKNVTHAIASKLHQRVTHDFHAVEEQTERTEERKKIEKTIVHCEPGLLSDADTVVEMYR